VGEEDVVVEGVVEVDVLESALVIPTIRDSY
jgi:hypothetical protein